ncbi:hypothetical protein SMC26_15015 [Actinomadura fulvescens]|uniref:Uncharacterized protein n=1 Tax=Actinomadura fulvescens TaxID=46160 RepID=A0ABN3QSV1_9ACTN
MTERSHGAPDPVEPSMSGAPPVPGSPTPVPPPETDLTAVRRTDALFDDLAARRTAASETAAPSGSSGERVSGDPAVRLLHALVADIDADADTDDPGVTPGKNADEGGGADPSAPGARRRGSRTFVALGVVGVVLAGTGVAAAGGDLTPRSAPAPETPKVTEEPRVDRLEPRSRPTAPSATPGAKGPAPAPVQGRPGARKPEPDQVRRQIEDLKGKLEDLLPPKSRGQGPGDWPFQSPRRGGDDDDAQRKLDDIRKQAQKRLDRYRDRYGR